MADQPKATTREEFRRYYGLHTDCRAGRDGDCNWKDCPQLNPETAQNHCPLDNGGDGE